MKRTAAFVLALCGAGALAFLAGRMLSERTAPSRSHCSLEAFGSTLSLTTEQQRKCAASDRKFEKERKQLTKTLRERRAKLLTLLRQPQPRREELDRALADIAEAQSALQHAVVDHLLRLKSILTPKQQDTLFKSLGRHMCAGHPLGGGDDCVLRREGKDEGH